MNICPVIVRYGTHSVILKRHEGKQHTVHRSAAERIAAPKYPGNCGALRFSTSVLLADPRLQVCCACPFPFDVLCSLREK